jgi:hypothetical protein
LMEEITNNAKVSNNFGSKDCTIGDSFIWCIYCWMIDQTYHETW